MKFYLYIYFYFSLTFERCDYTITRDYAGYVMAYTCLIVLTLKRGTLPPTEISDDCAAPGHDELLPHFILFQSIPR